MHGWLLIWIRDKATHCLINHVGTIIFPSCYCCRLLWTVLVIKFAAEMCSCSFFGFFGFMVNNVCVFIYYACMVVRIKFVKILFKKKKVCKDRFQITCVSILVCFIICLVCFHTCMFYNLLVFFSFYITDNNILLLKAIQRQAAVRQMISMIKMHMN